MVAQALLCGGGETLEVRPPQPGRDEDAQADRGDDLRAERMAARSHADRHQRLAEADDHEQAIALGEVRNSKLLQPAQAGAGQQAGAGVVDRHGRGPQRVPVPAVQQRTRHEQRHADRDGQPEPRDRPPGGVPAPGRVRVQAEVQQANARVGAREQRPLTAEGAGDGESGDEDQDHRHQQDQTQRRRFLLLRIRRPHERRPRPPHER
jgi:hypothetical protein